MWNCCVTNFLYLKYKTLLEIVLLKKKSLESEKNPRASNSEFPTPVSEYLFNSRVLICFHLTLALTVHPVVFCCQLFCTFPLTKFVCVS